VIEILKDKTNISNYVEKSHFEDYKDHFKDLKAKFDTSILDNINLRQKLREVEDELEFT